MNQSQYVSVTEYISNFWFDLLKIDENHDVRTQDESFIQILKYKCILLSRVRYKYIRFLKSNMNVKKIVLNDSRGFLNENFGEPTVE